VDDDLTAGKEIGEHLQSIGVVILGQATTAAQALEMFRQGRPDIILIEASIGGEDGVGLVKQMRSERRAAFLMVTAQSNPDLISRASAAGVFGYVFKPVNRENLAAQIEIALNRCRDEDRLIKENQTLLQSLETRKLVERAKGILMKRLNLDEPAAHRKLQQESQKNRIGLADLAKKIIESEKLMGE
jgi:response regulator NasT